MYRGAWIADTGERYIVQLGPPEHGGGHAELLSTGAGLEQLRAALSGWRAACGRDRSLEWLRERARLHLPAPVSGAALAPSGASGG